MGAPFKLPAPPTPGPLAGFAIAVAVPLAVTSLQLALRPHIHGIPFALYFLGAFVTTGLAGLGPGLVAVVLSMVLGHRWFVAPVVGLEDASGLVIAIIFFVTASVMVLGGAAVRAAYRGRTALAVELSRIADALRESEHRYRLLAANLPGGAVMLFDRDLRCLIADGRGLGALGVSPDQVAGRTVADLLPAAVAGEAERCLRAALEGQEVTADRTLGGREFEALHLPVRAERGEIVGALAIVQEVSERRRAEREVHRQERRFRSFVTAVNQMVWTTTPEGEVVEDSPSWRAFTGQTHQEWAGRGWLSAVHPDDRERAVEAWRAAVAGRQRYEAEYRVRRHDGTYVPTLACAAPVVDDAGNVVEWVGANMDITERTRAEEALHEAVRVRDVFLTVAGHELRTPLAAARLQIQGLQRLLARDGGAELPRIVKHVDSTASAVDRLGALVNALLDVSRLSSGRLFLEKSQLDLSRLVLDTAGRYVESAARQRCELKLQVEPGVTLVGDRVRLEQVVNNLLSNALKYGEGRPVRVTLARCAVGAALQVADEGIGIAPADHGRIFDRFERAVSARHFGGLGLGLWVVRQIVEASGGTIQVVSEAGRGSAFTVELPLGGEAAPDVERGQLATG